MSPMAAAAVLATAAATLTLRAAATAPLTKMVWVTNVYPNDFDFHLSYSQVHASDLESGKSKKLALTFRPAKHIISPWVRVAGDETLRAYNDDGHFVELDAKSGMYRMLSAHKVGADEAAVVKDGFFFADHPVDPKFGRLYAYEPTDVARIVNVHAMDPKTGKQLQANVGIIDVGEDLYSICGSIHLSWLPATEQLLVAKNYCSHAKPMAVFAFNPRSNSTTTLYTATSRDESFCGFAARPATGELFALVERHNITAFPDPDCQDSSGTVESMTVVRISQGKAIPVLTMGPMGIDTQVSGGPMDNGAGIWHLLVGGSVMPVNVTAAAVGTANNGMVSVLSGDVEGDYPVLVSSAGALDTPVVVV